VITKYLRGNENQGALNDTDWFKKELSAQIPELDSSRALISKQKKNGASKSFFSRAPVSLSFRISQFQPHSSSSPFPGRYPLHLAENDG
jgi:hypothetical protein